MQASPIVLTTLAGLSTGLGGALAALAKVNAEVVLITTSDLDISLLIHQEDEDVALNALNKAFEL